MVPTASVDLFQIELLQSFYGQSQKFPIQNCYQHNRKNFVIQWAKYERFLSYLAHWVTNKAGDEISGLIRIFQIVIWKDLLYGPYEW